MTEVGPVVAVLALLAGILILVWPRLLSTIVALYLIGIGLLALVLGFVLGLILTPIMGPLGFGGLAVAVLALIAGILILVAPGLLSFVVAIYLLVVGVLGLLGGVSIPAILALVAGILVLVKPRLLNYIVAIYLIVIGVIRSCRVLLGWPARAWRKRHRGRYVSMSQSGVEAR